MTKLKSLSALLVSLLVIVPFILAGSFEERGGGRVVIATSESAEFAFGQKVKQVTVFNSGASTTVVFVAVNSSTGQLDTAVAASNALPVRGGVGPYL